MTPITNVQTATPLPGIGPLQPLPAEGSPSFKDFLLESIRQVNSMQQAADQAVEKLATGGQVNPAEVLTAVQKADIAFRLMLQVRNKIIQAWEEIQAIRV